MHTPKDAIDTLIHILQSNTIALSVRGAAAEGLGFAGGQEARAALTRILMANDQALEVRAAAARALGHAARQ